MLITPAASDDTPEMATLMANIFAHTYGGVIPAPTLSDYLADEFTPGKLTQLMQRPNAHMLLARVDEGIVGISQMTMNTLPAPHPPSTATEIERFYIAPSQHGNGLAAQLLQASLKQAQTCGSQTLWLCVWQHNQRAVAFYRKHGFTVVGDAPVWVDTIHFHDYVMAKAIST